MNLFPLNVAVLLSIVVRINGQREISCGQRLLVTSSFQSQHWPWHAAIFHQIDTPPPVYQCGGTVITSRSVLTAGHCVSDGNTKMDVQQVSVSLGRLNLDVNESSAQNFEVIFILPFASNHPSYELIHPTIF